MHFIRYKQNAGKAFLWAASLFGNLTTMRQTKARERGRQRGKNVNMRTWERTFVHLARFLSSSASCLPLSLRLGWHLCSVMPYAHNVCLWIHTHTWYISKQADRTTKNKIWKGKSRVKRKFKTYSLAFWVRSSFDASFQCRVVYETNMLCCPWIPLIERWRMAAWAGATEEGSEREALKRRKNW